MVASLFAPLGTAMAELAARYDDRQLDAITSFLTGLEAILDDQTQALRASTPTREAPVRSGPAS